MKTHLRDLLAQGLDAREDRAVVVRAVGVGPRQVGPPRELRRAERALPRPAGLTGAARGTAAAGPDVGRPPATRVVAGRLLRPGEVVRAGRPPGGPTTLRSAPQRLRLGRENTQRGRLRAVLCPCGRGGQRRARTLPADDAVAPNREELTDWSLLLIDMRRDAVELAESRRSVPRPPRSTSSAVFDRDVELSPAASPIL